MLKLRPLPPEEAVAYFKAKGYELPPTWDWHDMWQEAHATATTVAKSAGFDILGDIHGQLQKVLEQGQTFRDFKKELTPVLQAKGWWGRKELPDPRTGEVRSVQLGSPRRLRTIYDVNLRTAHASGAWARAQRTKDRRPFLRYVAILDRRTRPDHRAWHGTVLPMDDPFWNTHYPPNGWRCRCSVQQLGQRDLDRYGYTVSESPPRPPMVPWKNPKTGEVVMVPKGIDPGWGYNPGKAALQEHAARTLMNKLVPLPPDVAAKAMAASARFVMPALEKDFAGWVNDVVHRARSGNYRAMGERRVVGALPPGALDFLRGRNVIPASGAITMADGDVLHMLRSAKGNQLPPATLSRLPQILARPQAILWDKQDPGLVYVWHMEGNAAEKVIVKVDYRTRVAREKVTTNSVRSGRTTNADELRNRGRYDVVEGDI